MPSRALTKNKFESCRQTFLSQTESTRATLFASLFFPGDKIRKRLEYTIWYATSGGFSIFGFVFKTHSSRKITKYLRWPTDDEHVYSKDWNSFFKALEINFPITHTTSGAFLVREKDKLRACSFTFLENSSTLYTTESCRIGSEKFDRKPINFTWNVLALQPFTIRLRMHKSLFESIVNCEALRDFAEWYRDFKPRREHTILRALEKIKCEENGRTTTWRELSFGWNVCCGDTRVFPKWIHTNFLSMALNPLDNRCHMSFKDKGARPSDIKLQLTFIFVD